MKQLSVGLVTKNSERSVWRDNRPMGWWSYAVDDCFTWEHLDFARGQVVDVDRLGYDLILHEDFGGPVFYEGKKPVVFVTYDSTVSPAHYEARLKQSSYADLILVDNDKLGRFGNKRVARFVYCVNDRLFKPAKYRDNDVAFHCSGSGNPEAREALRTRLGKLCEANGWTYRSGVLPVEAYAESMARSRVVVNLPCNPSNRPHRVFDAMACATAVLSAPFPAYDGDGFLEGFHYATWYKDDALEDTLRFLLVNGRWEDLADHGYVHVQKNHTWAIRAVQLRQLLNEEFGL